MEQIYEITKDVLAIVGLLAIIYHVWERIALHNWIKNNW